MTDCELLQLAALAAGLKEGIGGAFWTEDGGVFDPLTDDGDALRLAVKLHMNVNVYTTRTTTTADDFFGEVFHQGDRYAATRRAIVRAAAEIGKAMK